jgi:hypothetical protein
MLQSAPDWPSSPFTTLFLSYLFRQPSLAKSLSPVVTSSGVLSSALSAVSSMTSTFLSGSTPVLPPGYASLLALLTSVGPAAYTPRARAALRDVLSMGHIDNRMIAPVLLLPADGSREAGDPSTGGEEGAKALLDG